MLEFPVIGEPGNGQNKTARNAPLTASCIHLPAPSDMASSFGGRQINNFLGTLGLGLDYNISIAFPKTIKISLLAECLLDVS